MHADLSFACFCPYSTPWVPKGTLPSPSFVTPCLPAVNYSVLRGEGTMGREGKIERVAWALELTQSLESFPVPCAHLHTLCHLATLHDEEWQKGKISQKWSHSPSVAQRWMTVSRLKLGAPIPKLRSTVQQSSRDHGAQPAYGFILCLWHRFVSPTFFFFSPYSLASVLRALRPYSGCKHNNRGKKMESSLWRTL